MSVLRWRLFALHTAVLRRWAMSVSLLLLLLRLLTMVLSRRALTISLLALRHLRRRQPTIAGRVPIARTGRERRPAGLPRRTARQLRSARTISVWEAVRVVPVRRRRRWLHVAAVVLGRGSPQSRSASRHAIRGSDAAAVGINGFRVNLPVCLESGCWLSAGDGRGQVRQERQADGGGGCITRCADGHQARPNEHISARRNAISVCKEMISAPRC